MEDVCLLRNRAVEEGVDVCHDRDVVRWCTVGALTNDVGNDPDDPATPRPATRILNLLALTSINRQPILGASATA